ncbi:MAG: endo-1,4-beta-xylanase [Acidobacteria bacterium]|nr:endo-1,4-beta-xylanase [Acidobacteriota bacterium]
MFSRFKSAFALVLLIGTTLELPAQTALKDVFGRDFLIGAALNPAQFNERDKTGAALVKRHFNSVSPENVMKWEVIHPAADRYNFAEADRYVEFGVANRMFVVGHTLVWHNQTPKWVFEDAPGKPVGRDELLKRMREHIMTVVGRYQGKIGGWDVVNEALDEDGNLRQSPWLKIIGEDYIAKAFEFAHEADPKAQLYYNDYSLENDAKRRGAVALVKKLRDRKIFVSGIGTQGHWNLEYPTRGQLEATLDAFAEFGKVSVTELDVDVLPRPGNYSGAEISQNFELQEKLDPYKNGLPADVQKQLANRYAELFKIFLEHRKQLARVTFWGVADNDSWKNNFPVRGRTNYPLLFDREWKPKPAFDAVIETAKNRE